MIRTCILTTILLASMSVSAQVKILNDTLDTKPSATLYDILKAVANYHKLQLVITSPKGAYQTVYEVTLFMKDIDRILEVFNKLNGMKYVIEGKKLIVGRANSSK